MTLLKPTPLARNKSSTCRALCCLIVLSLIPCTTSRGAMVNVYGVGNSLTVDLAAGTLEALTANEADPLQLGYHIKCGSNLTSILANPADVCFASLRFGQYPSAFQNNSFAAVTLQPFYGSTIRQEVDSARQMITELRANPNNADTRVFIYATWSENYPGSTFPVTWNSTGANLDSPFVPTAEVYSLFMNELKLSVPEARLLPVGHIYNALIPKISQGLITGLSSINDLYRDQFHASGAGIYIADMVAYSVLYEKSPVGVGYPSVFPTFTTPPHLSDAGGRLAAQQFVWEAVQEFISVPDRLHPLDLWDRVVWCCWLFDSSVIAHELHIEVETGSGFLFGLQNFFDRIRVREKKTSDPFA